MSEQNVQNNTNKNKSNTEKLIELMTFDPVKQPGLTSGLFSEVLKEITDERAKEGKAKAKELLVKAMDLRRQMSKAEKDFNNQKQKFDKELGKFLNQINGMLSGKAPEECAEETENKEVSV